MRIVQINSVCDVGSTGRIMADLARKANANGDETICAYGRRKGDAEDLTVIRIGNDLDIIIHIFISRIFDMHGLGSKRATRRFLKQMDEFGPDMFHIHNLHGYYINYPMLFEYIKLHNISVRWTFHDSWPFTGHCAGPACYDCNKWLNSECAGCTKSAEYPKSVMVNHAHENFLKKRKVFLGVKDMKIITPSNWLAGLVRESFLGGYEVEVVHNTIDTEVFKPTESNFRRKYNIEGNRVYLCVAFVWPSDKLQTLFAMTHKFDSDEVLILVGTMGKEKKMLKGNDSVIAIERTDSKKELAEIYTAADVFINPTVKDDNYPTVNLEAQACGTYVVTYDSGGGQQKPLHRVWDVLSLMAIQMLCCKKQGSI